MKRFVKDLTDFHKIGREETRVSVMSFSNYAVIHIRFSTYFSHKSQFDNAVDRIQYTGGGTATSIALNMAYNDMFTLRYGARGPGKNRRSFTANLMCFLKKNEILLEGQIWGKTFLTF